LLHEFPTVMIDALEEAGPGGGEGEGGGDGGCGGGLLALVCAIQTPGSLLNLSSLLSLGRVSLIPAQDGSVERWGDGVGAVVESCLAWDAVDVQSLWVLLAAELASQQDAKLEAGVARVVALLDASTQQQQQQQQQGAHLEVAHGCITAMCARKASPRLVYIASHLSQALCRLPGQTAACAAAGLLSRWARTGGDELSAAISHLLLLQPLAADTPDVSSVITLLSLWLKASQGAPVELVRALACLRGDPGGPLAALRQELSLCPDWTTQELERLLLHVPKEEVDAGVGGSGVGGGRGGGVAKRGRGDDGAETSESVASKRSRRGTAAS